MRLNIIKRKIKYVEFWKINEQNIIEFNCTLSISGLSDGKTWS